MTSKLERQAAQLGALGHPVRLRVLRLLVLYGADGVSAGEIQGHLDMPASSLSHHLKRLVDAGLLTTRNEGTFHYYAVDYGVLRGLTDSLWEDCCKHSKSSKPGCC